MLGGGVRLRGEIDEAALWAAGTAAAGSSLGLQSADMGCVAVFFCDIEHLFWFSSPLAFQKVIDNGLKHSVRLTLHESA